MTTNRWRSLDLVRPRARLIEELTADQSLAASLTLIADAIQRSFPENLFCDLDLLARFLRPKAESERQAIAARIARLQQLFGDQSPIRFRYVHDFLYGFDWARWVAKAPEARAHVGPYDDAFLGYLETRGQELLALIEDDDAKYPTLRGPGRRNPFPFSREPEAEIAIHRALAAKNLIPVPAWSCELEVIWDRPFAALREAEARRLGLSLDAHG